MFRVRLFVLNAIVPGGALSKQSEAGRRTLHEGMCFARNGLLHLADLLQCCVSSDLVLTAEGVQKIGHREVTEKVQCFEASDWNSSAKKAYFVAQHRTGSCKLFQ
jgi:hypothetical protein